MEHFIDNVQSATAQAVLVVIKKGIPSSAKGGQQEPLLSI